MVGLGAAGAMLFGIASSVGNAATTASSADAGVGADAAPPQSIYLTKAASGAVLPPSIDDAEAFCALVNACADVPTAPPAPDFQGCVKTILEQLSGPNALNTSLTIRECGLSATSCKRLRACVLKGADAKICDGVATEGDKAIGKCDMDARAVTCWRGKVTGVRNCGLADELCSVKDGRAECTLFGACPASFTSDWSCANTRMVKCTDGKPLSIDCAVLGLTCVKDPTTGVSGCAPPVATKCRNPDKIVCDGATAIGCTLGREVKVACGDQGMTCGDASAPITPQTVGACEVPAPKDPKLVCDPKSYGAKCAGADIEYCSPWGVRKFPCKSIGATKCVMDKGTGPRCGA